MIHHLKLVCWPKKVIYENWSSAKIRRLIIHEVSLPSSNLSKSAYLATKQTLDDKLCNYLQKCVWEFQNLDFFLFYRRFLKIMVLKGQCYLKYELSRLLLSPLISSTKKEGSRPPSELLLPSKRLSYLH